MQNILIILLLFASKTLLAQSCFSDIASNSAVDVFYSHQLGGGVSFCDFDMDGRDDLSFATSGDTSAKFYKNSVNGFVPIEFVPHTEDIIKTIIWVDFDNDGDKDLFYTVFDGHNKLFQNDGSMQFADITESVGLSTEKRRSLGAAWADINRDGFLDLYYSARKDPGSSQIPENKVYLNQKGTHFLDATQSMSANDPGKYPFCSGFLDYNQDKWPDIYIAHDRSLGNTLLENKNGTTFLDVSAAAGAQLEMEAMCVATADVNNDGLDDIYIANNQEGNALLINQGDNSFIDQAEQSGTQFNGFAWGSNFLDINNDQLLDIFTSGTVGPDSTISSTFFINEGLLSFRKNVCGLEADTLESFSNAIGDLNNDGKADIVVSNNHGPAQIFRNDSENENFWLKIKTEGVLSNKDGIGTEIYIYTGTTTQKRTMDCGGGFLAQNSLSQIIGLGAHSFADSILVHWPTGHIDRLYDIPAMQSLEVKEGESTNGAIHIDSEIAHHYGPETMFQEVHVQAGIDHVSTHSNFMGGGLAFVDINNDGYDDLYMTSGSSSDKLYLNNADGSFTDISDQSGITSITENVYSNGVIFGDVNNDGLRDLFVFTTDDNSANLSPNLLLINHGNLSFLNVWDFPEDKEMSLAACFIDYDQDGLLDIYVGNYVENVKFTYDADNNVIGFAHDCFPNKLYRNNGNLKFEDVTAQVSLEEDGCALAVLSTDFDRDGDSDIFLANDFGEFITPNSIFKNNSDSQNFTEVAEDWNANTAMYAMGIAAGDIELDGDMDYYFTNFGANSLLVREGSLFNESAVQSGVDDTYVIQDSTLSVSWGTAFLDYDNDMYPDLYVANGYVPGQQFIASQINNNDKFYTNNQDGTFTDVDPLESGIDDGRVNRGMAYSDFDRDGDLDLATVSLRVPMNDMTVRSKIYQNNLNNENNWLGLDLEGVFASKDAYGAFVQVYVGGKTLIQEHYGGSSHCSQNSSTLHFGIGLNTKVDSIEIDWPSKIKDQKLYNIDANQILHVLEDISLVSSEKPVSFESGIEIFPNPSRGQIFVRFSKNFPHEDIKNLEILNSHGMLVQNLSVDTHKIELDLVPGFYTLHIRMKNGMHERKPFICLK